jgi:hypothetical protein
MSGSFSLQRDLIQGTTSFFMNLTCEYSSRKARDIYEGLEVNGTHQLLQVCVDGVDSLVENKFRQKKHTEVVLVANKLSGSEVNSKHCI